MPASDLPERSAWGLLQEELPAHPLWLLVGCALLNRAKRSVAEPVFRALAERWPTREALAEAESSALEAALRPLGFQRRRAALVKRLAASFGRVPIGELPSVGEYAERSHEIFCGCELGDEVPEDGPLVRYWRDRRAARDLPDRDCSAGASG